MLDLWIQTLTFLEKQGLWIQSTILHCSYAKVVSLCADTTMDLCVDHAMVNVQRERSGCRMEEESRMRMRQWRDRVVEEENSSCLAHMVFNTGCWLRSSYSRHTKAIPMDSETSNLPWRLPIKKLPPFRKQNTKNLPTFHLGKMTNISHIIHQQSFQSSLLSKN